MNKIVNEIKMLYDEILNDERKAFHFIREVIDNKIKLAWENDIEIEFWDDFCLLQYLRGPDANECLLLEGTRYNQVLKAFFLPRLKWNENVVDHEFTDDDDLIIRTELSAVREQD